MKRFKKCENFSDDAQSILIMVLAAVMFGSLGAVEWAVLTQPRRAQERENTKKMYNSLEVLKYNGDTIEFVFHDRSAKRRFAKEWRVHNYGQSIKNAPVNDNMRVLKFNNDTIQIKFDNAKFQRQFEKQWRKYSDHKLNHIKQNAKHR